MRIREANKNDCEKLDTLLTKLIHYEARYDANINCEYIVSDNYSERLDWPGHKAFAAEEDGEIVGFVYGFVFPIPGMYFEPIAIADAMYVEEAYRNRGIATKLLQEFIDFAAKEGACRIELKVMSENTRAMRTYESLGFDEKKKYMALDCR